MKNIHNSLSKVLKCIPLRPKITFTRTSNLVLDFHEVSPRISKQMKKIHVVNFPLRFTDHTLDFANLCENGSLELTSNSSFLYQQKKNVSNHGDISRMVLLSEKFDIPLGSFQAKSGMTIYALQEGTQRLMDGRKLVSWIKLKRIRKRDTRATVKRVIKYHDQYPWIYKWPSCDAFGCRTCFDNGIIVRNAFLTNQSCEDHENSQNHKLSVLKQLQKVKKLSNGDIAIGDVVMTKSEVLLLIRSLLIIFCEISQNQSFSGIETSMTDLNVIMDGLCGLFGRKTVKRAQNDFSEELKLDLSNDIANSTGYFHSSFDEATLPYLSARNHVCSVTGQLLMKTMDINTFFVGLKECKREGYEFNSMQLASVLHRALFHSGLGLKSNGWICNSSDSCSMNVGSKKSVNVENRKLVKDRNLMDAGDASHTIEIAFKNLEKEFGEVKQLYDDMAYMTSAFLCHRYDGYLQDCLEKGEFLDPCGISKEEMEKNIDKATPIPYLKLGRVKNTTRWTAKAQALNNTSRLFQVLRVVFVRFLKDFEAGKFRTGKKKEDELKRLKKINKFLYNKGSYVLLLFLKDIMALKKLCFVTLQGEGVGSSTLVEDCEEKFSGLLEKVKKKYMEMSPGSFDKYIVLGGSGMSEFHKQLFHVKLGGGPNKTIITKICKFLKREVKNRVDRMVAKNKGFGFLSGDVSEKLKNEPCFGEEELSKICAMMNKVGKEPWIEYHILLHEWLDTKEYLAGIVGENQDYLKEAMLYSYNNGLKNIFRTLLPCKLCIFTSLSDERNFSLAKNIVPKNRGSLKVFELEKAMRIKHFAIKHGRPNYIFELFNRGIIHRVVKRFVLGSDRKSITKLLSASKFIDERKKVKEMMNKVKLNDFV